VTKTKKKYELTGMKMMFKPKYFHAINIKNVI
jgi:hypothetical protein